MILFGRWIFIIAFCISRGYSQEAAPFDLVINEILFNPSKDGYDYVEVYNRSNKTINLENIRIANRNSTGDVSGMKVLSKEELLFPPGAYLVITANEKWMRQNYSVGSEAVISVVSSMPSFPDDNGTVILLNTNDTIIDELNYSEKWHFGLITEPSGISLERMSYQMPAQDKNNWTSASSSSGFGTPGYQNSQFRSDPDTGGEIVVSPKIFSPDNDGTDDFGMIHYNMKEQGYVANLIIYDVAGRRIRYLLKNEILGISGQYKWDGLDDEMQELPQGIYILVTQLFNLKGNTKKFKHVITLARRM